MDAGSTRKAKLARAAYDLAECVEILELRHRAHESQRKNSRCPCSDDDGLLRSLQRLGFRLHANRQREVLRSQRKPNQAWGRLGDLAHTEIGIRRLDKADDLVLVQ